MNGCCVYNSSATRGFQVAKRSNTTMQKTDCVRRLEFALILPANPAFAILETGGVSKGFHICKNPAVIHCYCIQKTTNTQQYGQFQLAVSLTKAVSVLTSWANKRGRSLCYASSPLLSRLNFGNISLKYSACFLLKSASCTFPLPLHTRLSAAGP